MKRTERERFDELLEAILADLPPRYSAALDEVPLIVEDEPPREFILELLRDDEVNPTPAAIDEVAQTLCGLHTGRGLADRSVEDSGVLPDEIRIFRRGVIALAGGWDQPAAEEHIAREIRITLLHEIGHHFGLEENDLSELGYE